MSSIQGSRRCGLRSVVSTVLCMVVFVQCAEEDSGRSTGTDPATPGASPTGSIAIVEDARVLDAARRSLRRFDLYGDHSQESRVAHLEEIGWKFQSERDVATLATIAMGDSKDRYLAAAVGGISHPRRFYEVLKSLVMSKKGVVDPAVLGWACLFWGTNATEVIQEATHLLTNENPWVQAGGHVAMVLTTLRPMEPGPRGIRIDGAAPTVPLEVWAEYGDRVWSMESILDRAIRCRITRRDDRRATGRALSPIEAEIGGKMIMLLMRLGHRNARAVTSLESERVTEFLTGAKLENVDFGVVKSLFHISDILP